MTELREVVATAASNGHDRQKLLEAAHEWAMQQREAGADDWKPVVDAREVWDAEREVMDRLKIKQSEFVRAMTYEPPPPPAPVSDEERERIKAATAKRLEEARAAAEAKKNQPPPTPLQPAIARPERAELVRPDGILPPLVVGQTASPKIPTVVARDLVAMLGRSGIHVVRWRSSWYAYSDAKPGRYRQAPDADDATVMTDLVRSALEYAHYVDDEEERKPWNPTVSRVREVVAAIETLCRLPSEVETHSWRDPTLEKTLPRDELIVVRNGILHVPRRGKRKLEKHTPGFFTEVALDIDYDPNKPPGEPKEWFRFLRSLWPDEPGPDGPPQPSPSISTLQEWFGYVLSGATRLHKILLLIGPPRSGKGTIVWVLECLLGGPEEIARPTFKSLGGAFGLAPLLGKRLAVVGDARGATQGLVEHLLTVSGEDPVQVNRKYKPETVTKLDTRFVIVSNEEPHIHDASGALPDRMVPLRLVESFLGREDLKLKDKLKPELPAILGWALDGLDRLRARPDGAFTMGAASTRTLDQLREDACPVCGFLDEMCDTGDPAYAAWADELWSAWSMWANTNGFPPMDRSWLGRELRAVDPRIEGYRPRVDGNPRRAYRGVRLRARYGV